MKRLDPNAEFVVFGVVTEFCVGFAAKGLLDRGRRVSVVKDAIETLNPQDGQRAISELKARGARFVSTTRRLNFSTLAYDRLCGFLVRLGIL